MIIFTIVCCHGNSLQHTDMHGKEIPRVLLVFTVNARRFLNSSFLVLRPSSGALTVNTVGSHLKVPVKV